MQYAHTCAVRRHLCDGVNSALMNSFLIHPETPTFYQLSKDAPYSVHLNLNRIFPNLCKNMLKKAPKIMPKTGGFRHYDPSD